MYFRLSDQIGLRHWTDIGYAFYRRGARNAVPLSLPLAQTLLLCDAEHDIEMDGPVLCLLLRNMIEPCEKGEHPSPWSAYRNCDSRYFPMMNLMITGKCNFNCLHCFNAADNAALMSEWNFNDLCGLFDEARDCGIASFMITGGEPMAHRHFLDIIREIYKRGMSVFALNTNGWYITQEILDELKNIGCCPEIKISFDGAGTHDWLRQREGAEKRTIEAIRLCIDNGFPVMTNTQIHRGNVHTMMPTARLLNDLGVTTMRIIRTTEVPRWAKNAPGGCLGIEEYYEQMLAFAAEYIRSGMDMKIVMWQLLNLYPRQKSFALRPVKSAAGAYRDSLCCCESTRSMVAVNAEGEILPCNQMSGYFLKKGIRLGNVRHTPLKELLRGGTCVELAKMTVGDVRKNVGKCRDCPYFEYCGGGCRALGALGSLGALETQGSLDGISDIEWTTFLSEDVTKCIFFENGWYAKFTQALSAWTNLREIKVRK